VCPGRSEQLTSLLFRSMRVVDYSKDCQDLNGWRVALNFETGPSKKGSDTENGWQLPSGAGSFADAS